METKRQNYSFNKGYISLFLSLLLGSLRPIFIKIGVSDLSTPIRVAVLSAIIAGLIAFTFNRPNLKIFNKFKYYIPGLLLLLNTVLTAYALKYTNLVTVITIISLTPIVVAFHKLFLEKSTKNLGWFFAGFVFAFLGILQVIEIKSFEDFQLNLLGIILSVLVVIVSDTYRVFIEKKALRVISKKLSSIIVMTGGLFSLAYIPFDPMMLVNTNLNFWIVIILLAISITYSNLLFIKALKMVGALTTSLVYIMQPAVVVILGILFISEPFKMNYLTGIGLIIFGLFIFKFPSIHLRLKQKWN